MFDDMGSIHRPHKEAGEYVLLRIVLSSTCVCHGSHTKNNKQTNNKSLHHRRQGWFAGVKRKLAMQERHFQSGNRNQKVSYIQEHHRQCHGEDAVKVPEKSFKQN